MKKKPMNYTFVKLKKVNEKSINQKSHPQKWKAFHRSNY
jgi:hypothetical protein